MPLIEGKFDHVFSVTMNHFGEALMFFLKVAVNASDGYLDDLTLK